MRRRHHSEVHRRARYCPAVAVEVGVEPMTLVVRFTGWDVVWALRRGAWVPLDHVTGAHVDECAKEVRTLSLRVAGSYVPKVLASGLYRSRGGGRQLWAVRRSPQVLVVDLRDEKWDRIVLEVADPAAVAARIEAARSG